MRLRSFFEHAFFAFGTAFTCFVILMSSTLQARTVQIASSLTSSQMTSTSLSTIPDDLNVHGGMIYVEAMMPKQPLAPQDFCFEDTQVRSCVAPSEIPFDSAPSEFLPASLERPTLNLV